MLKPQPPIIQKLPLMSVQYSASARPPGMFPAAGIPNVPYIPGWPPLTPTVLLPPIHPHCRVNGTNTQSSFRSP